MPQEMGVGIHEARRVRVDAEPLQELPEQSETELAV
jgi:hypothetical protein